MKRLECTKCRQLQHDCKCDTQTLDYVDMLRDRYRYAPDEYFEGKNGAKNAPQLDKSDKVS